MQPTYYEQEKGIGIRDVAVGWRQRCGCGWSRTIRGSVRRADCGRRGFSRPPLPRLAEIQGRQRRRDFSRIVARTCMACWPRMRRDLANHSLLVSYVVIRGPCGSNGCALYVLVWSTENNLFVLAVLLSILILLKHSSNLQRIIAGLEPRIGRG